MTDYDALRTYLEAPPRRLLGDWPEFIHPHTPPTDPQWPAPRVAAMYEPEDVEWWLQNGDEVAPLLIRLPATARTVCVLTACELAFAAINRARHLQFLTPAWIAQLRENLEWYWLVVTGAEELRRDALQQRLESVGATFKDLEPDPAEIPGPEYRLAGCVYYVLDHPPHLYVGHGHTEEYCSVNEAVVDASRVWNLLGLDPPFLAHWWAVCRCRLAINDIANAEIERQSGG